MGRRSFAVVAALGAALLAPAGAGAAAGFHAPVMLPGSSGGTEPSLAISSAGLRYPSWQVPGEFARSTDGVHFTDIGSPDTTTNGDVTNDVSASGALYNAQICGGATSLHTCVYRSLDQGASWRKTDLADQNPGASDRPWIAVRANPAHPGNPDLDSVYLEYHTFSPDDLTYMTVSHDGGKTFSAPIVLPSTVPAVSGSFCDTIPGGVAIDRATGYVYTLWLSGNDLTATTTSGCNYTQIGPFNRAWVAVSKDNGATFTSYQAWAGSYDPLTGIGDNADKIFGTLDVDRSGQVQVVLPVRTGDDPKGFVATGTETPQPTHLLLVTSPDQAQHFTPPVDLTPRWHSAFFPWVAAGSAGRLAIVYYRSDTLQPNNPSDVWYIGFLGVNGATAKFNGQAYYPAPPVLTTDSRLQSAPVHLGGICTFGIFCTVVPNANRNLADSIAIELTPAGGAEATWTNDNTAGQTPFIQYACQSSGASFLASKGTISGCYRGAG